jgi:hypothetical protein
VIPDGARVFLCVEPVDMRLGFDRLAQVAENAWDGTRSTAARCSCSVNEGVAFKGALVRPGSACYTSAITRLGSSCRRRQVGSAAVYRRHRARDRRRIQVGVS